jgi:glycerol-3-phosphate dehydrogenase (NAD(P)+)
MKISVLGCGRWGSFIGWYLVRNGHDVIQWGTEGNYSFDVLKNTGKNEYVSLDDRINLTSNLKYAIEESDIIVISISAQGLRDFVKRIIQYSYKDKIFVLCMKGIEVDTGKRLSEILIDCGIDKNQIAVWVGPGHIQAFTQNLPNCMVIDAYNEDLVKKLCDSFRSNLIRFYYGEDIIGSEIGAAAKNVMGIAAGMLDGGGYTTLKGPLMARGAREIARLIKAMGGNELSAYGLCHLGDYETTLFSEYSNNRKFGEMYVKKEPFKKLAEGVSTAKALKFLGEKYGVDLPITNAVYSIIYENKEPMSVFLTLFSRSTRFEF